MDLKKYRKHIASKLLADIRVQANKAKSIENGSYHPNKPIKQQHVKYAQPPTINEDDDDDDDDEIEGGKFHFMRTMKHIGKSVAKDLGKVGKAVKNSAIKSGSEELGKYVYNGLKTFGSEALPVAEAYGPEVGEAALLAAGLPDEKPEKKPRKPRKPTPQTEKQKRRQALVKHLMNKHGVSLPEASAIIKKHNMKY